MHEMSIVQALLEQVETEVQRSGHDGRVVCLDLVIGRMSGVHVDSIRFAFEILSPDTIAAGAELRIAQPRAEFQCTACSFRQEIDQLIASCPECESSDITFRGGQDLILQSIELEDAGEPDV